MVRILLVDDHPLVRSGLRAEIEACHGMQVAAEAGTAAEALARLAAERPAVAVIDVQLGDGCGIDLGRRIVAQTPCAVVLLTAFDWDVYLVQAWEAGAAAFIAKSADTEALVAAIRKAADGERAFSDAQRARIAAWRHDVAGRLAQLSDREYAVLRLLAEGATNREIAAELGLALKTVEAHVHRVLHKLRQSSRRAVQVWAQQHRITSYGRPDAQPRRPPE